MSNQSDSNHRINPRYRAYGRARLDIAQRARTRQDWDRLWKRPQFSYPFVWGQHWKQCIEYRVDDFAAEVGFLIDVLGLPVNAFNQEFAMFTGLDREFYFAVTLTPPGAASTPPDAIRIQFMVDDLFDTFEELQRRGVVFDAEPQPVAEGSLQWIAAFRTPHGICMELWGMVEPVEEDPALSTEVEPALDVRLPISQFMDEDEPEPELEPVDEAEDAGEDEADIGDEDVDEPDQPAQTGFTATRAASQQPGRNMAPPPKPQRLFKNSQEMLDHLRGNGKPSQVKKTPGSDLQSKPAPAAPPVFRPAPKPASPQSPQEDELFFDSAEEDDSAKKDYHYKPIPFHKE